MAAVSSNKDNAKVSRMAMSCFIAFLFIAKLRHPPIGQRSMGYRRFRSCGSDQGFPIALDLRQEILCRWKDFI